MLCTMFPGGKKRKPGQAGRFKEEWEYQFLFTKYNGLAKCLVCQLVVLNLKKHSLERHYNRKHKQEYGLLKEAERMAKLAELKEANEFPSDVSPKEEMLVEFQWANADSVNSNDHSLMSEPVEGPKGDDNLLHNFQLHHDNIKQRVIAPDLPPYLGDGSAELDEATGTGSTGETEFDLWARSLAMQLNNMDLGRALRLQLRIQSLVTEDRILNECNR